MFLKKIKKEKKNGNNNSKIETPNTKIRKKYLIIEECWKMCYQKKI